MGADVSTPAYEVCVPVRDGLMKFDSASILKRLTRLAPPSEREAWRTFNLVGNLSLGRFGDGSASMFFQLPPADVTNNQRVTRALLMVESPEFSVVGIRATKAAKRSGIVIMLRDSSRLEAFATLVAHAASKLRRDPDCLASRSAVDAYLSEWIRFFSRDGLSQDEAVGLWGELFVLASMPNVEAAVPCWVGPYGHFFDFSGNGTTLEIKTSLRSSQATISLEQVEGRDGGHIVFIRALPDKKSGKSLGDLIAGIRRQLSDCTEFDMALMRVGYIGVDHPDLRLTAHEVTAIPNAVVPRPVVSDARVKRVRFSVDVDSLPDVPVGPLLRVIAGLSGRRKLSGRVRHVARGN